MRAGRVKYRFEYTTGLPRKIQIPESALDTLLRILGFVKFLPFLVQVVKLKSLRVLYCPEGEVCDAGSEMEAESGRV